jgi:hypothetical protein
MIKKNVGIRDRMARVFTSTVLLVAFITGYESGTTGIICLVSGGIFLLTGITGFCPVYSFYGMDSKQPEAE